MSCAATSIERVANRLPSITPSQWDMRIGVWAAITMLCSKRSPLPLNHTCGWKPLLRMMLLLTLRSKPSRSFSPPVRQTFS